MTPDRCQNCDMASALAAEVTALRVANARLKRDLAKVREQYNAAIGDWVDRIGHLGDERDEYRAELDMCREDRDALQARVDELEGARA
jgi:uncharacterized coiled-coil DUF342 family protein